MPDVTDEPSAGFAAVDSCAIRRRTLKSVYTASRTKAVEWRFKITDIFYWTAKLATTARLQAMNS